MIKGTRAKIVLKGGPRSMNGRQPSGYKKARPMKGIARQDRKCICEDVKLAQYMAFRESLRSLRLHRGKYGDAVADVLIPPKCWDAMAEAVIPIVSIERGKHIEAHSNEVCGLGYNEGYGAACDEHHVGLGRRPRRPPGARAPAPDPRISLGNRTITRRPDTAGKRRGVIGQSELA
jgi:hypothetical protein